MIATLCTQIVKCQIIVYLPNRKALEGRLLIFEGMLIFPISNKTFC